MTQIAIYNLHEVLSLRFCYIDIFITTCRKIRQLLNRLADIALFFLETDLITPFLRQLLLTKHSLL